MAANRGIGIPPGTQGVPGPQGDPGAAGATTFAALTDLDTAVVPEIDIKADTSVAWTAQDPLEAANKARIFATPANSGLSAQTVLGQSVEVATLVDDGANTSFFYESGAKKINGFEYDNTVTALDAKYSMHSFVVAPPGSVEVDGSRCGNMIYISNQSGGTVTLIPHTAETFNGASSFDALDNMGYVLLAPSGSTDYLVLASQAAGTFAGLTDLTTAVVPQIDIDANNGVTWKSVDGGDPTINSKLVLTSNSMGLESTQVQTSSGFLGFRFVSGVIFSSGAQIVYDYEYDDPLEDTLIANTSQHVLKAGCPVLMYFSSSTIGNKFTVINQSGLSVTMGGLDGETFNGAASIALANNKAYMFESSYTNLVSFYVWASP